MSEPWSCTFCLFKKILLMMLCVIFQFDPAVQRFLAMRANHFEHFRATPKSAMFGFAWVLGPFLLLWWAVDKDRVSSVIPITYTHTQYN